MAQSGFMPNLTRKFDKLKEKVEKLEKKIWIFAHPLPKSWRAWTQARTPCKSLSIGLPAFRVGAV